MGLTLPSFAPTVCEAISSISKSWRGQFWFAVSVLGWRGWLLVILGFLGWTAVEFIFGGSSANGFSWRYNVAVGSVTFAIFETIIMFVLSTLFGDAIYCLIWPFAFHLIPFWLTGAFWRWTGFWVY